MDKKVGIVGGPSYFGLATLLGELAASQSTLTEEEKEQRRIRRRERELQQIRSAKVIKNICPDCDGKLMRGKKEKKLDYKRVWNCNDCHNKYDDKGNSVSI